MFSTSVGAMKELVLESSDGLTVFQESHEEGILFPPSLTVNRSIRWESFCVPHIWSHIREEMEHPSIPQNLYWPYV